MLNYKSLEEKRWTKVETPVEEISSVAVGNDKIYILSGNTVYAANLDKDGKVSSSWESYKEGISRLFDNQAGTVYIVKEEKPEVDFDSLLKPSPINATGPAEP